MEEEAQEEEGTAGQAQEEEGMEEEAQEEEGTAGQAQEEEGMEEVQEEEGIAGQAQQQKMTAEDQALLENFFKSREDALDPEIMKKVIRTLFHDGDETVVNDFVVMCNGLANGLFDPKNVPFLLSLERAKFECLKSTTQMRYRDTTKLFWKLLKSETTGRSLRFAGGPKSAGAVLAKRSARGKYDPRQSKINFAIPSGSVLTSADPLQLEKKSEVAPGIIVESFDYLDAAKDFVLMADGKGLARGQLPGGKGDVDMFGHENKPTKKELQAFLENTVTTINALREDCSGTALLACLAQLAELLKMLLEKSDYFQNRKKGIMKRFQSEQNKRSFDAGIAWVKSMDFKIRSSCRDLRNLSLDVAAILAHRNRDFANFRAGSELVHMMSNYRSLRPVKDVEAAFDVTKATELVKPGSEEWKRLRVMACITADKLFHGIGLSTFKDLRAVIKEFHSEEKEETLPDMVPLGMLATVASRVMPLFFPRGLLTDFGVKFYDGDKISKLLAASPDIVIKNEERLIPVVMKSGDPYTSHCHQVQQRDICRAVAEMAVLEADECLHVSYNTEAAVVHRIPMTSQTKHLWEQMFQAVNEIYDHEEGVRQPASQAQLGWRATILSELEKVQPQRLIDLPCIGGSVTVVQRPGGESSAFNQSMPRAINDIDTDFVNSSVQEVLSVAEETIVAAHTLLRPAADEIFAILATDTDQVSQPNVPAHIPVAYGLKGGGISTEMLRGMMDDIKDEMKTRNLRVVCEIMDGYHHSYMERDSEGTPLYLSRLQIDTWNEFHKMGKKALLQAIDKVSVVLKEDLDAIAITEKLDNSFASVENLIVRNRKVFPCPKEKRVQGLFVAYSRAGPLHDKSALDRLVTRVGAWCKTAKSTDVIPVHDQNVVDAIYPESKDDTLPWDKEDMDEEDLMRATIEHTLLQTNPSLLLEMVNNLSRSTARKRTRLTCAKLLELLQDGSKVATTFTLQEIQGIRQVIEKRLADRKLFSTWCKGKERQASVISLFFGGSGHVNKLAVSPEPLAILSKEVLQHPSYPTSVLQIALAHLYFPRRKRDWLDKALETGLPMEFQVDSDGTTLEMFSYPEKHKGRGTLEPKVTDPYHILTNARKGATTGVYNEVCSPEAWHSVVKADKKLLTYSIVDDVADKQNADLARRVFSEEVQAIMTEDPKHFKSAEFVYHIRRWFEACDKRGLSADERVSRFVAITKYLTNGISFQTFPPSTQYIKSIPIVTFEAILANVATRLHLYDICKEHTYNQRSISTLAVENFFSTLARTSPTGMLLSSVYLLLLHCR
jgi:hypothetical protein